jgi:1-acyl-sn-glycerol-3-phosphate acyltransferase
MILIRSTIFFFYFIINTLFFAGFGLIIGWFLPGKKIHLIDTAWSRTTLWGLKRICGLSYRVEGKENIPKDSCIVLSNHQSTWETIALITLIPHPKVWVLKRELLYLPIFGWVMIHFKPIAINRKAGRKSVKQIIEQGTKRLNDGYSVIIFPEGTRVPLGEKKRYGVGAALLAEKSGYPILPIAHNAGVFWKRRGIIKYPGVIDVRIGPIIMSKGIKAIELNNLVENWIELTKTTLPMQKEIQ